MFELLCFIVVVFSSAVLGGITVVWLTKPETRKRRQRRWVNLEMTRAR